RERGGPAAADPPLPFAPSARSGGSRRARSGWAGRPAPLHLDLHPGRVLFGLAAALASAARALPLPHARRGAGVRLLRDGGLFLPLLLSALDRAAADRRRAEQPRLVRPDQAAAQLVPLLLDLPGLALVAGCLILGLGLAAGGPPWLTWGERAVIGIVLAVVGLTLLGYVLAFPLGVSVALVLLLALLGLSAGGYLLWRPLPRLRSALRTRPWGRPATISLGVAIAVVAVTMGYLFLRAVEIMPDAWVSHYNNTWSDWSFHASYTTTFVYGNNLPPQNPIFAGTPFRYTFAPDFASALLVAGGWTIPASLAWPSWAMTVLALSGLILWARRLTGGIWTGVIAVTLTLLGGGIGF